MADNNNPVEENAPPNGIQVNARDRLFHAIFIKAAAVYIRVVPKWCRGLFEVIVLAKVNLTMTLISTLYVLQKPPSNSTEMACGNDVIFMKPILFYL